MSHCNDLLFLCCTTFVQLFFLLQTKAVLLNFLKLIMLRFIPWPIQNWSYNQVKKKKKRYTNWNDEVSNWWLVYFSKIYWFFEWIAYCRFPVLNCTVEDNVYSILNLKHFLNSCFTECACLPFPVPFASACHFSTWGSTTLQWAAWLPHSLRSWDRSGAQVTVCVEFFILRMLDWVFKTCTIGCAELPLAI